MVKIVEEILRGPGNRELVPDAALRLGFRLIFAGAVIALPHYLSAFKYII